MSCSIVIYSCYHAYASLKDITLLATQRLSFKWESPFKTGIFKSAISRFYVVKGLPKFSILVILYWFGSNVIKNSWSSVARTYLGRTSIIWIYRRWYFQHRRQLGICSSHCARLANVKSELGKNLTFVDMSDLTPFLRNASDFGDNFFCNRLTCNSASFGEKKFQNGVR